MADQQHVARMPFGERVRVEGPAGQPLIGTRLYAERCAGDGGRVRRPQLGTRQARLELDLEHRERLPGDPGLLASLVRQGPLGVRRAVRSGPVAEQPDHNARP